MRKVVSGLFIALDGVVESPYLWQFEFDDEMGASMNEMIAKSDTILMGRVTYQEWADYWPNGAEDEFADFINPTPKVIISTTLDSVAWGNYDNITLERNLADAVATLKQQPGKDITVAGSPTVVRSLLEADLLDELVLSIHPTVAGKGKHLFGEGDLKRLQLVSATTTSSGVVIATYQPFRGA